MERLTEERFLEIEARAAKATPGAWFATAEVPDDVRVCRQDPESEERSCVACLALMGMTREDGEGWTDETLAQFEADAAFIAHAREDIPALLAEMRHRQGMVLELGTALFRLVYVKGAIKEQHPDIYPERRDYAWQQAREALERCGIRPAEELEDPDA